MGLIQEIETYSVLDLDLVWVWLTVGWKNIHKTMGNTNRQYYTIVELFASFVERIALQN